MSSSSDMNKTLVQTVPVIKVLDILQSRSEPVKLISYIPCVNMLYNESKTVKGNMNPAP